MKTNLVKVAADLRSQQQAAQDLVASLMAEPEEMAEAALALAQNANPLFWLGMQQRLAQEHSKLLASMFLASSERAEASVATTPAPEDRRFSAPEWEENAWFRWLRDAYLINSKLAMQAIAEAELEPALRQKLAFYTRLMVEALSPSNHPLANPEAIKAAVDSRGESIAAGARNLLADLGKGYISLTDEAAFEIGRNIACTPGEVIYENAVMQLIQYRPLTKQVHERPLLIVPPFINKFYIMDLEPENSFVRWTIEQGHQAFLISFKNATEAERHLTWDDYVDDGVIAAMEVVREVTGSKDMNVLAFCTGGTLTTTAFAPLIASRRKGWVKSLTLLAAGLEFTDVGEIGVYMDSPFMRSRAKSLAQGGVMPARDLAAAFTGLKANDLVWSNVVNHYLKGKSPAPFGLLYWNSDPTSLPGPLFAWYIEHTYMGNKLVRQGETTVCGKPLDLDRIKLPTYAMGAIEDHIVPWHGAYASARYLGPKVRFCLTAGGHIAGTMNPASKNRRNYWVGEGDELQPDPDKWFADAQSHKGSWWNDWGAWVKPLAGKKVEPPAVIGSDLHPPIEPAPGRYVKERSV